MSAKEGFVVSFLLMRKYEHNLPHSISLFKYLLGIYNEPAPLRANLPLHERKVNIPCLPLYQSVQKAPMHKAFLDKQVYRAHTSS